MRSVVLLCLLPLVLGGAVPGQEKCAWGPSYWCSHISHARECGATQHCLQTVWKNQIIKPESTKTCTYCELIVNELRDVLQDKVTEEKVAEILSNVCAILPSTDDRNLCVGVVTEYAPELMQMFLQHVSTDMICAAIDMCSGLEDTVSPYGVKADDVVKDKAEVSANNDSACTDCMKFFKDVQDSITSNSTVNQLTQLFNQTICNQLGGFSETCVDLVKQYLPIALQALADQIDPDIVCRVFGFCTSEGANTDVIKIKNIFQGRQSMEPLKFRSSEECDICKDLFNQIVEVLRNKDNQDKIIDEAKQVCNDLGSLADECKQLVDQYAPMLFELLVNELDPTTVCEAVGLCQTPSLPQVILAADVKPASMVGPGYIKNSVECELCKIVMTQLDNYLKENGTVKKVEDLIDKVCARLPTGNLVKQCEAFVAEYGELVVQLIAQELDPNTFCGLLKLCSNGKVIKPQTADAKCSICEEVIGAIEAALANVSSEELMNGLKQVCSYIPGNYSDTCLKYVNEYGSLIINMLKSKEDPHSLCMLAQMCSSSSSRTPYMTKPIPEQIPGVEAPSTTCEVCNTFIFFLKSMLSQNATKQEIEAALDKVCTLVPSEYQSECDQVVKQYGPILIKFLVDKLDINTFCKTIHLCPALDKPQPVAGVMSPYDTLPLFKPEENIKGDKANGIECETCKEVMTYMLKELDGNTTEAAIKAALVKACSMVKQFEAECDELVNTYLKALINYIELAESPEQICEQIHLCAARTEKLPEPVHVKLLKDQSETGPVNADVECVLCEFVMKELKNILKKNSSEAEIEAALDKVCSLLPDTISQECEDFVKQYAPVIEQLLLQELDPNQICTALKLCTSKTIKPFGAFVKILPEVGKETGPVKSAVTCKICKVVMGKLDEILGQNRTEAEIKVALDKVCSLLPSAISQECTSLVDTYTDQIVQLLIQFVSPDQICTAIGLCTSKTIKPYDAMVEVLTEVGKEPGPVNTVVTCEVCEKVMGVLADILGENSTEAEIKGALDKVCSLLPSTISEECKSLVNTYTDQIVQIIQLMGPNAICTELKLCTSKTLKPFGAMVKAGKENGPVNAVKCEICKVVITKVKDLLKENSSKAEIKAALDKVCSLLPDTISQECEDFVQQYAPVIEQLLLQELDPNQICKDLKLCTSKTIKPFGAFVKILPEVVKGNDVKCDGCKLIIEAIQQYLKQNRTEEELKKFLERLCGILPDTVTVQCNDYMDNKLQEILDMLKNSSITPEQVCVKIEACPPGLEVKYDDSKKDDDTLFFKPHPKLVGQKKCTFGPAYWCASPENAKECNAIEHCQKHVWN